MKKVLLILVLMAYISSTIGATVSMHYCMGKLVGTEIGKAKQKKCPNCGMREAKAKKKKCCSEKEHQVKVKAEHQKATKSNNKALVIFDFENTTYFYSSKQTINKPTAKNNVQPHSPPILYEGRLHVLYSVFLI